MKVPAFPPNENQRLKDLADYGVLDTGRETTFDQITEIAATLCGTKMSLVSLVDADRQWFKSCYGIEATETVRSLSFCAYAILGDDVLIVEDTFKDDRFVDNPAVVGEPHIRFYAGAPLITPRGTRLGTLCVVDQVPRKLTSDQIRMLQSLARHVMDLFELKKKTAEADSFAQILNQTTDAMVAVAPPNWKFNFANPAALKFFGAESLEQFFKLGPSDVSPVYQPDGELSAVKAERMIKQALETGNAYFEWCHTKLDGTVMPTMVQLSRIYQGNETWCLGSVRDVTSEKALERQLLEAQSIAKVGSWTHYLTTGEVTWSSELFQIVELKGDHPKSTLFLLYRDRIHPDDLPKFDALIERAGRLGEDYVYDHRLVFDNGDRIKYVQAIGRVTKDQNGKVVSLSGTLRDRTSDVVVEEKFRRLLEENQFILDTLGIGVWKSDMQTGSQVWDKNVYDLFEVDENDFSGDYAGFLSYLTEDSRQKVNEDWAKILKGLDTFENTFEILTPKKKKKYLGTKGIVIRDGEGKPSLLFGINWDRTRDVELEKSLQLERAKSFHSAKLASIGQLAAGVGHEINNPLAVITGHLTMAEQMISKGADPTAIMEKLHKMENSVNRITNIVKGLRTFARSDSEDISEFDPFDLARESVDLVADIFQREGVSISLRKEKLPVKIQGNRGRLQQVLINLLSNAKDATAGQQDRRIDVIVSSSHDHLSLVVKDNGHGIPPEIREKIFDPFFTTKDINSGTGIGLSLVNTIIKEHHGKIDLRSEVGKGTEFEITLPVGAETEEKTATAYKKKTPLEKYDCRVLVVDDEPELREVLKEILALSCVEVYSASSAREALSILKSHKIDTVISDIKMPVVDGFELLKQVRKENFNQSLRFYFITGGIEMSSKEKDVVRKETDGVFYKPIKLEQIVQKLREHYPVISP